MAETKPETPKPKALPFEEARQIVLDTVRQFNDSLARENVALDDAHGRVLAEPLVADRDYPALDRSLRDGFALGAKDVPGTLKVRGELRAGDTEHSTLSEGEAIEIMTGAPVPFGADAIVMVEHVTRHGTQIKIDQSAEPGQFINRRGAEATKGTVLIEARTRLDASHIAALAAAGQTSVSVFARPKVAILATGDEIVGLGEQPAPHQIRNSNSYMLAAMVRATGGIPTLLPVARDTREALLEPLKTGLAFDFLIVTGGVSAGKYDLVKPALQDLGVEFLFERVRVQPGQPTAFGVRAGKPLFGLPGNPGSSMITYQLFARPALELLCGVAEPILPLLTASFSAPFRHKGGLTRFLPARLTVDGQHLRHISWQGSSDVPALSKGNCLLVADHDRLSWEIGDSIRVMMKP